MKKLLIITSSTLLTAILSANETTVEGNLKSGFTYDNTQSGDSQTIAIGGSLSVVSKKYFDNRFQFGTTFSTTNPLFGLNDTENSAVYLLSADGKGYSLLTEAYVTGTIYGGTSLLIGRKFIDTPFADTNDMGMIKNSFEVYLLEDKSVDGLTLTAGKVMQQAGIDANIPEKFTKLNGSDGVNIIGAEYSLDSLGLETVGWLYNAPDMIDMFYFDINKALKFNDIEVTLSGQFAKQDDGTNSNTIFGGNIEVSLPAINSTVFVATNITEGELLANNGFGGGPFYTSIEQNTIGTTADEVALAGGVEYELNENIILSGVGSLITLQDDSSLSEIDLIAGYQIDESSGVDLYFSQFEGLNDSGKVKSNSNLRIFYNQEF